MSHETLFSPCRIIHVSLSDIDLPSACRRRRWTEEDDELARSIARYGVLQPVALRKGGSKYQLISGTRRFYACRRAGLKTIPAIIFDIDSVESELMAFTENMQRRPYDFVEEAEELHRLITVHGISQEDAARRMGRSPSAVSNKLRLLKMPRELLYTARDAGLTERHVRTLLRLSNSRTIAKVMQTVIENDLSVSETEKEIDKILCPAHENLFALSSPTLFMNTLNRSSELMRKSGYDVDLVQTETDEIILLNITLSKKPSLC